MEDQRQAARDWWNNLSTEDQMWLMLVMGYDTPLSPSRVTITEIEKLYLNRKQ